MAGALGWYVRRLARMSPRELAHRLGEQTKKLRDARRDWSWQGFAAKGAPAGLALPDTFAPGDVAQEAAAPRSGQFRFLSQDWPGQDDSWPKTIWHLDPVTAT